MKYRLLGGLGLLLAVGCSEAMSDPDAGSMDASPMDAAMNPDAGDAGGCTSDAECDDGLFCNGVETCNAGACSAGTAPECDDGVTCTLDTCDEDDRACENTPPDIDGDGVADAACLGADGLPLGRDCDDTDANRFPDNPEICDDGHDEDCDPTTFGDEDFDRDHHVSTRCCNTNEDGTSSCGDDCDDAEPNVYTMAPELCDDRDNDCNGLVDDDITDRTFGIDCDGDRFGVITDPPIVDCGLPSEPIACPGGVWVPDVSDCDDTSSRRHPGLVEVCDGVDNDCDADELVDDGLARADYFPDCDLDSHGDASATPLTMCTFPSSAPSCAGGIWATNNTDCDDMDVRRHAGRPEMCDGVDNNCDAANLVDEGLTFVDYFPDCDGDSHGDASATALSSCLFPASSPSCAGGFWATNNDDCDDANFSRHPGRPETCDGVDNNCDAANLIDEGLVFRDYTPDCDADGYGDAAATATSACSFPTAAVGCGGGGGVWSLVGGDCNDAVWAVNPGASDGPPGACNTVDDDCDGVADEGCECVVPRTRSCGYRDATGALVSTGACAIGRESCNGGFWAGCVGAVFPSPEVCEGSVDENCDGNVDEGLTVMCYPDGDDDSWPRPGSTISGQCLDATRAAVGNCPVGFTNRAPGAGTDDCDDGRNDVYPGRAEICGDGQDNDCDGDIDDGCPCAGLTNTSYGPIRLCERVTSFCDVVHTRGGMVFRRVSSDPSGGVVDLFCESTGHVLARNVPINSPRLPPTIRGFRTPASGPYQLLLFWSSSREEEVQFDIQLTRE